MPCRGLITHFAAAFAPFLHYLTSSSSSSSGNGRREKLGRTALRRRRRRCRKARSQFRNQIGPPNDRLFARSSVPSLLGGNVARHVSKREWGLGRKERAPILQRDRSDHRRHHNQPHHRRHESQSFRHGFDGRDGPLSLSREESKMGSDISPIDAADIASLSLSLLSLSLPSLSLSPISC